MTSLPSRKGIHRLRALCRWVSWGPTGNWASINPDFTMPCRSCRSAMSAPSLRLLLCRHAPDPFCLFRLPVRRRTFGTFLRFPTRFSGIRFELSRRGEHERTLEAVSSRPGVRTLCLLITFSNLKNQLVDGHHEPSSLACTVELGTYGIDQTHLAFQDEMQVLPGHANRVQLASPGKCRAGIIAKPL